MSNKSKVAKKESIQRSASIKNLRIAFRKNSLVLYVGAGASSASGIPLWDRLVLNLFLNSHLKYQSDYYSQAIGEYWFSKSNIPLEIAARQIRNAFNNENSFVDYICFSLYSHMGINSNGYPTPKERLFLKSFLRRNKTLMSIVKLCRSTRPGKKGIREIISYNFDGLIEMMLESYPCQPIWKPTKMKEGFLPIYHVHGYLPVRNPFSSRSSKIASLPDEIVLTEDQYHKEMENSFSWGTLAQLRAMSNSVVLTIGLSLSDPNLRRLLDVIRNSPTKPIIYAVLQRPPKYSKLENNDMQKIERLTLQVLKFYDSLFRNPLPRPDMKSLKWRNKVKRDWAKLIETNNQRQLAVFHELGIIPFWCNNFEKDIPDLVNRIIKK